jgi:hypothetical protein
MCKGINFMNKDTQQAVNFFLHLFQILNLVFLFIQ